MSGCQHPRLVIPVEGTATVLQACRSGGIRQLVYMSSAEVHGQPVRSRVAEDHPIASSPT
jgi:UDP-glucose 4-epimerase